MVGQHVLAAAGLALAVPVVGRAPDCGGPAHVGAALRNRNHRRASQRMVTLVIEPHPHHSLVDLWPKLVRRLARTGSTCSGVGTSDKPGAVHPDLDAVSGSAMIGGSATMPT